MCTPKQTMPHSNVAGREPETKSPWHRADPGYHSSRRTGTWNMRLTRRWRGLADRRSDQVRQSRRNMAGLYRAQEAGTGDEGILDGCDGDGGSAMLGAAAAAIGGLAAVRRTLCRIGGQIGRASWRERECQSV